MIVLVRHGETDANRARLLLGRADPGLTERGRQQATALADVLTREPAPVIVTSPLARAEETATRIGAATGVRPTVEPRLTEIDYGEWDQRRLADLPAAVTTRWRADPDFAPPGGESLTGVRARVAPCAADLVEQARDRTVIAVSHVSPIKAIVLWALDLDDVLAWRLRLDLASISRLAGGPSGLALVSFNETGHLA